MGTLVLRCSRGFRRGKLIGWGMVREVDGRVGVGWVDIAHGGKSTTFQYSVILYV